MVFPGQYPIPNYTAPGSDPVRLSDSATTTKSIDRQLAAVALVVLGFSSTTYVEIRQLYGLPLRPPQVVACLIALLCLPLLPRMSIPRRSIPLFVVPLVLASYMLLRHAMTDSDGMLIALRFVVCALTYVVCLVLIIHSRRPHFLMVGLIAGAIVSILLAARGHVLFDVDPIMRGSGRWQGLMPGANRLGNLCVIALLGLLASLSGGTRFRRGVVFGGIAVLLFFGALMTGSRGALLALVFGGATYLVLPGRYGFSLRLALRLRVLLLTALLAVGAFELFFGERLAEIVQTRLSGFARRGGIVESVLYDARRTTFDIALQYWLDGPWLGSGSDAERFYGDQGSYTSTHNSYLYLLSTSGLVGFAVFLALPWLILRRLRGQLQAHALQRNRQSFLAVTVSLSVLICVLAHFFVISLADALHIWAVFAWCAAPTVLAGPVAPLPRGRLGDLTGGD